MVLLDKLKELEFAIRKRPTVKQLARGGTSCSACNSLLRVKADFAHTREDAERKCQANVMLTTNNVNIQSSGLV